MRTIVIVTDAARGIGRAIAIASAREVARVVVVDIDESAARSTADEIRGQEQQALPCPSAPLSL